MGKVIEVLSKPVTQKIMKIAGVSLVCTSSAFGAMSMDEKVKKLLTMAANKIVKE